MLPGAAVQDRHLPTLPALKMLAISPAESARLKASSSSIKPVKLACAPFEPRNRSSVPGKTEEVLNESDPTKIPFTKNSTDPASKVTATCCHWLAETTPAAVLRES